MQPAKYFNDLNDNESSFTLVSAVFNEKNHNKKPIQLASAKGGKNLTQKQGLNIFHLFQEMVKTLATLGRFPTVAVRFEKMNMPTDNEIVRYVVSKGLI